MSCMLFESMLASKPALCRRLQEDQVQKVLQMITASEHKGQVSLACCPAYHAQVCLTLSCAAVDSSAREAHLHAGKCAACFRHAAGSHNADVQPLALSLISVQFDFALSLTWLMQAA